MIYPETGGCLDPTAQSGFRAARPVASDMRHTAIPGYAEDHEFETPRRTSSLGTLLGGSDTSAIRRDTTSRRIVFRRDRCVSLHGASRAWSDPFRDQSLERPGEACPHMAVVMELQPFHRLELASNEGEMLPPRFEPPAPGHDEQVKRQIGREGVEDTRGWMGREIATTAAQRTPFPASAASSSSWWTVARAVARSWIRRSRSYQSSPTFGS